MHQNMFHLSPLTLVIAVAIHDSDVELFIHIAKASHENRSIHKMK